MHSYEKENSNFHVSGPLSSGPILTATQSYYMRYVIIRIDTQDGDRIKECPEHLVVWA